MSFPHENRFFDGCLCSGSGNWNLVMIRKRTGCNTAGPFRFLGMDIKRGPALGAGPFCCVGTTEGCNAVEWGRWRLLRVALFGDNVFCYRATIGGAGLVWAGCGDNGKQHYCGNDKYAFFHYCGFLLFLFCITQKSWLAYATVKKNVHCRIWLLMDDCTPRCVFIW